MNTIFISIVLACIIFLPATGLARDSLFPREQRMLDICDWYSREMYTSILKYPLFALQNLDISDGGITVYISYRLSFYHVFLGKKMTQLQDISGDDDSVNLIYLCPNVHSDYIKNIMSNDISFSIVLMKDGISEYQQMECNK